MKIDFITALISHSPGFLIARAIVSILAVTNIPRHFYKLDHHEIR